MKKSVTRGKRAGAISNKRSRQRFSDMMEFRRGRRDGETGRAALALTPVYAAGYSEGRRARIKKSTEQKEPRDDLPPSSPSSIPSAPAWASPQTSRR